MSDQKTVLIADSQDISRAGIASVLTTMNINVLQAIDGGSAIKVIQEHPVDLVIFDHGMKQIDGYEFARYLQGSENRLPRIMLHSDPTSDMLNYASAMDIKHILTKPVEPKRLEALVLKLLGEPASAQKQNITYSAGQEVTRTPDEMMAYIIDLARKNVATGHGGPFAAVVANADGVILGQGVNLHSSRFDPIAHAEVMAIRQATEKMQQPHLEGCALFATSQPTSLAQALINSVGISTVYYGLTHDDISRLRPDAGKARGQSPMTYTCLGHDQAIEMFTSCQYDQTTGRYRITK